MSQFESNPNKKTETSEETFALLRSINRAIIFKNTQSQYFAFVLLISFVSIFALICSDIAESRPLFRNVLCVVCGILFFVGTLFLLGTELSLSVRCKNWNERMAAVLEAPNKSDLPLLLASLEAFRNEFVNVGAHGGYTIFDMFVGNLKRNKDDKHWTAHRFNASLERPIWQAIIHLLPEIENEDLNEEDNSLRRILHDVLLQKPIYDGAVKIYNEEKPEMQPTIVSVLKVTGDSRDLTTLREVASGRVPEIALSIRQEAEQAIEAIMARMGGEQSRQELLRASSAVSVQPNELLRAAGYGAGLPKNEMLRASQEP